MLSDTSTRWAPWYVVPADHRWFAHIAVGAALALTLMEIDPHYPEVDSQTREELERACAAGGGRVMMFGRGDHDQKLGREDQIRVGTAAAGQ